MNRLAPILVLLTLCIMPMDELLTNCSRLCGADNLGLSKIEHSWNGYKCICENDTSRTFHTAKTIWVAPTRNVDNE